jgi:predicted membrane protein
MLATSLPTGIARDDWSHTQHTYTQVTEFPVAGDSRDMGQVTTDLSKLKLTADATYTSHVDFGSLTVIVPPDAQVRVDYSVDSGAVEVFDRMVAGGTELHDVLPPGTAQVGSPTLTLDLSVDHGRVVVRR